MFYKLFLLYCWELCIWHEIAFCVVLLCECSRLNECKAYQFLTLLEPQQTQRKYIVEFIIFLLSYTGLLKTTTNGT